MHAVGGKSGAALLALLAAAAAAPAGSAYAADEIGDPPYTDGIREFKQDVRLWLAYEGDDKKSAEDKVEELQSEHDELLRVVIEWARITSGTPDLTDAEISAAIDYITLETIKDEKRKIRFEDAARYRSIDVIFFPWIPDVPVYDTGCAPAGTPTDRQVQIESGGGAYSSHAFDRTWTGPYVTDQNEAICEEIRASQSGGIRPMIDAAYDDIARGIQVTGSIEYAAIKNDAEAAFGEAWESIRSYARADWAGQLGAATET